MGSGTVGQGLIQLLRQQQDTLADRTGLRLEVTAVFDRSYRRKQAVLGDLPASDEPDFVLENDQVDVVVELLGGISPAREFVRRALANGKSVVTANKALLALHGKELFELARSNSREIGFEAAVAGTLPVIQNMRRIMAVNEIAAFYGILNGTCNFVISRMQDDDMDYGDALRIAQEKGFAEADPSFDVGGRDAAQKLAILAGLAFDAWFQEDSVITEGITEVTRADIAIAGGMGFVIRLLAVARRENDRVLLRVHPALLPAEHILASVKDEKNAVYFDASYSGPLLVMGNGAGAHPTAAAVVSDLVAIGRHRPEAPELGFLDRSQYGLIDSADYRFYLRFRTEDRAGVLAEIARVLAARGISIATVHQQEGPEPVDVVVITYRAPELQLLAAIKEVDAMAFVRAPTVKMRIEDLHP